jgi:hypothetical protein
MKLCAVSIDLDEIHHYFAIHGLGVPEGVALHAGYDVALPRACDFAESRGLPLTLFAVGADLTREGTSARITRRGTATTSPACRRRRLRARWRKARQPLCA